MKSNSRELAREKLVEAFRNLPLLPNAESKIHVFAEELIVIGLLSKVNDLPRSRECSEAKALRELEGLAKKAITFRKHILTMHRTSLDAIKGIPHPLAVLADIETIIANTRAAVSKAEFVKEETVNTARKRQAPTVMKTLAAMHLELTGQDRGLTVQEDKATGELFELTQKVFNALGIDASAESQIREHRRKVNGENG